MIPPLGASISSSVKHSQWYPSICLSGMRTVGGRAWCSEKPGTLWPWLTVTKTESALESWGLPRMLTNLFFHRCPGVPDLPILSPQPALLLLPLGASCLPSSRKPLSSASKKGGRMSPCPGQVVGQERAAPALTHCWEERKKPAGLAGCRQRSSTPANLLPVLGTYQVHDQIRRTEKLGEKDSGLGERKTTITFKGSRKAWARSLGGRRPLASEAKSWCVPRQGRCEAPSPPA